MSYHDTQQVCLNGHQITDRYNGSPEFRRNFCNICGAKTINKCPNCNHPIKGDYHVDGVVAIGFTTPVPNHCENCGKTYPWEKVTNRIKRVTSLKNIYLLHGSLSMYEKIGLWGSIASIIGLVVVFFSPSVSSDTNNSQTITTSGNQSPAIGANNGEVIINYNNPENNNKKSYVLRNTKAGATLVVSAPSLDAAGDPAKHICMAPAGTPIDLTGKTAKMGVIDMWREVKITSGSCVNKIGWAALENISYE